MAKGRNGDLVGDGDDVSLDTFMSTTSCPSTLTPDGDDDRLSIGACYAHDEFHDRDIFCISSMINNTLALFILILGSSLRGSPFPEETYSPSNFNSPAHRLSHESEEKENRSPSRQNGNE